MLYNAHYAKNYAGIIGASLVTEPAKISHVVTQKSRNICYNVCSIYTIKLQFLPRNLMENPLQFNTPFRTEDIHEYLSRCNLCSHGLRSYMYTQSMICNYVY